MGMQIFPEIREVTMLCVRVPLSRWSSQDPIVYIFQPASPTLSDSIWFHDNIYFRFTVRPGDENWLWNIWAQSNKWWPQTWFWFTPEAILFLLWRLWRATFLTLPLGFRVVYVFETPRPIYNLCASEILECVIQYLYQALSESFPRYRQNPP